MSMGGDFYAMSDEQLHLLLNEDLDYSEFLYDELEVKPQECYSGAEYVWFDLTQLLATEGACGLEVTDVIPESAGYSFASEVKIISHKLNELSEEEFRQRFESEDVESSYDEIYPIVKELTEFYKRAAQNGNAVLFRVT